MPAERILYVLGAGFSAPLGLPVSSNFLTSAKDLHSEDPEGYSSFSTVFNLDREVARIGRFFQADFFNVEEVFSVLEMGDELAEKRQRDALRRFICDVIQARTPPVEFDEQSFMRVGNPDDQLFGRGYLARYGHFVANLFRLGVKRRAPEDSEDCASRVGIRQVPAGSERYAILTMNYDMVLEQMVEHLRSRFHVDLDFAAGVESDNERRSWGRAPYLAKLHGSAASGDIIPPTWSKSLRGSVEPAWRLAHALISSATKIRVIGYSLPALDSNVRFLLKAGVLASDDHLKELDVVCLDEDGSVYGRYSQFFSFKGLRFASASVTDYLDSLNGQFSQQHGETYFTRLEGQHRDFMAARSRRR